MLKSECFVGQIVHFTCNGRGRGGHYSVRAEVTKVNSKNALLTESKGSYSPGTRWNWPISELRTDEQDRAHGRAMLESIRTIHPELLRDLRM
jgi:hypothetical protein